MSYAIKAVITGETEVGDWKHPKRSWGGWGHKKELMSMTYGKNTGRGRR